MVRLYRDAGGIIFCKTNVPQASPSPNPKGDVGSAADDRPSYRSNVRTRSGGLPPTHTIVGGHVGVVQEVKQ